MNRVVRNLHKCITRDEGLADSQAVCRRDALNAGWDRVVHAQGLVDDRVEILEFRQGLEVWRLAVGKGFVDLGLQLLLLFWVD